MNVLGDLVDRERPPERVALRADAAGRGMDYRDVRATARKAGNFLRYLGVSAGDRVAVADDPRPEPVLALFGAALLGATTTVGVDGLAEDEDAPRAVVAPADREAAFDLPARSRLLVYGGAPERARSAHWEGDVWSENPAFPPVAVDPAAAALRADRPYSHAALLDAAAAVVADYGIGAGATVAVGGSLARPGVLVAGVLAPLLAGGTAVFPGPDTDCAFAVGGDAGAVRIDPDGVV
ncbi:MAG: AMP-binding protein [Halobacteriales archaeon]